MANRRPPEPQVCCSGPVPASLLAIGETTMRFYLAAILSVTLAGVAIAADQRVFGVDGSVYRLNADGTYQLLESQTLEGRINFHFNATRNNEEGCALRLVLTNSTDTTIRHLAHVFKVFSRRDNDTLWFVFGGSADSEAIRPGEIGEDERTFEKGNCEQITDIEPFLWANAGYARNFHVDGMSAYDSKRLFSYPDIGVLRITPSGE